MSGPGKRCTARSPQYASRRTWAQAELTTRFSSAVRRAVSVFNPAHRRRTTVDPRNKANDPSLRSSNQPHPNIVMKFSPVGVVLLVIASVAVAADDVRPYQVER